MKAHQVAAGQGPRPFTSSPCGRRAAAAERRGTDEFHSTEVPLVAHCLAGALRTFTQPQIFGRIKSELVDAFSKRNRVFVVGTEACWAPNNNNHRRRRHALPTSNADVRLCRNLCAAHTLAHTRLSSKALFEVR